MLRVVCSGGVTAGGVAYNAAAAGLGFGGAARLAADLAGAVAGVAGVAVGLLAGVLAGVLVGLLGTAASAAGCAGAPLLTALVPGLMGWAVTKLIMSRLLIRPT